MNQIHNNYLDRFILKERVEYGRAETPLSINCFLYRGGAAENRRLVARKIAAGDLGPVIASRLQLVEKIYSEINGRLIGGGSKHSAETDIAAFRKFFAWADHVNYELNLTTISTAYLDWSDALSVRHNVQKDINQRSVYSFAASVGTILGRVLERAVPLISLTALRFPSHYKTPRGVQAEKQNLDHTFAFGHLMQDLCDELSYDSIFQSTLPVVVNFRNGKTVELWSRGSALWAGKKMQAFEADRSLRTRHPLVNIRIEAELMMFIGQTGMNASQACTLRLFNFQYVSHLDGYQVKDRKDRRGGDVIFEIFKAYKSHFERYLAWRRQIDFGSELVFPFIRTHGAAEDSLLDGHRLRKMCKQLGEIYISARLLRNTRVNWLLRKTADPDLTAEMMQSTKETLLTVYELPSQQRAISEIIQFWKRSDSTKFEDASLAAGVCSGMPATFTNRPENSTLPDCLRPSGCLWCASHKDIDSQDYVWSLTSFGYLKTIEISKWRGAIRESADLPANLAAEKIQNKLRWFYESNDTRRGWVEEAQARVEEGDFHPLWHSSIISGRG